MKRSLKACSSTSQAQGLVGVAFARPASQERGGPHSGASRDSLGCPVGLTDLTGTDTPRN